MSARRREPLVLLSTRTLLDSVLNPEKAAAEDGAAAGLRLRAGILRRGAGDAVVVSPSVLRILSITSGSLVSDF